MAGTRPIVALQHRFPPSQSLAPQALADEIMRIDAVARDTLSDEGRKATLLCRLLGLACLLALLVIGLSGCDLPLATPEPTLSPEGPEATATPEPTEAPTPAPTPTKRSTPLPTATPTVAAPTGSDDGGAGQQHLIIAEPTFTPSPTPSFRYAAEAILVASSLHPACTWFGVAGEVLNAEGEPRPATLVHVYGPGVESYVLSGTNLAYGAAGWEVPVRNDIARDNIFWVRIEDGFGNPLSPAQRVEFVEDCRLNTVYVTFSEYR